MGQNLVGISHVRLLLFILFFLRKIDLERLIQQFYDDDVRLKFESENYMFDVYVTKDGRIKVLDFNPWGAFALPLLFDWEELEQNTREEGNNVDFRIVESQCAVRPDLKTAVPYDYLDTSTGSGWDQFLRNADEDFWSKRLRF
jgi:hypothetical protein